MNSVEEIRGQFPALEQKAYGKPLVYYYIPVVQPIRCKSQFIRHIRAQLRFLQSRERIKQDFIL